MAFTIKAYITIHTNETAFLTDYNLIIKTRVDVNTSLRKAMIKQIHSLADIPPSPHEEIR
jgi:hypothetical protein